ncbi:DUF3006 domain-containing protein (plasmid) [Deinococcus psychrotolerans]|uniref:DUF3006 domain-containing protein n=1 Tax=Deinococcus psychrotolerans TaxID=2489213 RepID=A0A3G8YVK6_9DEIO|nr:DUF3006 domain-containing protein [Deinococcus psychrotolerans]AZI45226.1 DUF3006 domain-containing protein [Deinococcus psychrotolerans]
MSRHEKSAPHPEPLPLGLLIVDGLEGDLARVELPGGGTQDILLSHLPHGLKEGDAVLVTEAGAVIDHAETQRRREGAQTQLDALNAQAPSGEIDL